MTELTARQQELLDELLKDFKGDAREIFGEGGLLKTEVVRKNWTVFFAFLSILSRRVMPLGAAAFVCRIPRRGHGRQVPYTGVLR